MRRFLSLATALLLTLVLATGARGAGSVELVRAFVYGDTLYAYVAIDGDTQPITKADAQIGTATYPASGTLETVRQAGSPVMYLLLLDASTSMPSFRQDVEEFAAALAAGGGENTRFVLATFGREFTVLGEDLIGEELPGQVEAVAYTETASRLHSGIQGALDYLEDLPRSGNELRCVVVLSDAVEYDPEEGDSYEEALERIEGSDVMLHSVGFGTDADSLNSLGSLAEASGGRHFVVGGDTTARSAGEMLTEEMGGLYVTGFVLTGTEAAGPQNVSITFAAGSELVGKAEREVVFPEPDAAQEPSTQQPPSGQEHPEIPPASQGGGEITVEPQPEPEEETPMETWLVAGGAVAVLVVLIVAMVLLIRRRKKMTSGTAGTTGFSGAGNGAAGPTDSGNGSAASASTPGGMFTADVQTPAFGTGESGGIYMRLEVLQGTYLGSTTEFTLSGELTIGRDGNCDMAFAEASLSRRHARVFTANGVVYVEDLGSQNGTRVNGTALTMACALRSGDEIAMGDVVIRLKF